jgi:hypothetical protein
MILPKHTLAHLHCGVELNAVPDATPQPRAREIWVRRADTRHHLSIGEVRSHLNPALFLTSKRQTASARMVNSDLKHAPTQQDPSIPCSTFPHAD